MTELDYLEMYVYSFPENKHLALALNSLPAGALIKPYRNSQTIAFKTSWSNLLPIYMEECGFSSFSEMGLDDLPGELEEAGAWALNNGEREITTAGLIDEYSLGFDEVLSLNPFSPELEWCPLELPCAKKEEV